LPCKGQYGAVGGWGESFGCWEEKDEPKFSRNIEEKRRLTGALFWNIKVITSPWVNGKSCTCEEARAQWYKVFTEGMEIYERFGHVVDALRVIIASSGGVESRL